MKVKATLIMMFLSCSITLHAQVKYILPDDFRVSDSMLRMADGHIRHGEAHSFDLSWFIGPDKKEALIIKHGTDYFREYEFLILREKLPPELLYNIDLEQRTDRNTYEPLIIEAKK